MHTKQNSNSARRGTGRIMLAGMALAIAFGFSISAQAQDCVVSNWDDHGDVFGLTDSDAGTQGSSNRRYGGPCGLRVPFGNEAWVENSFQQGSTTPLDEAVYKARFYGYFDDLSGSNIPIFAGFNGADAAVFQVSYSDSGEIHFEVFGATTESDSVSVDPGFWHSIEVVYDVANDQFTFSVDGDSDTTLTTTLTEEDDHVVAVRLGDIATGGAGSGTADFDDYDSRRTERPGRLLRGDATASGTVDVDDAVAAIDEFMGRDIAPGNPDCNEDGNIDVDDFVCAIDIFMGRD